MKIDVAFDFEELKDFIETYCNSDENISTTIYLDWDGIYETTYFNIKGRKWTETKKLLERRFM